MLRWMLGNLLVWAVLFFGVPYAGVRLCRRSGHDVHDGALAGGIPALHRAGEPFGRTAQMEHPVAAAGASRAVRIGSVAGFPHCAGACILRGLSGRGVRLLGSGLGHEAPPPAPGTAGAEQGFSIERRKGQNSVDVIHAVLFLCGDGDGTAHSGKMILKTGRIVTKYAGSLI